jgi:hypothetical protein
MYRNSVRPVIFLPQRVFCGEKDFGNEKTINTFARTKKTDVLINKGEVGEWLKPAVC